MRLVALIAALVWASSSFDSIAQERTREIKAGDILVLSLNGDLAIEYGKLNKSVNETDSTVGLGIEVIAVAERIENERVKLRSEGLTKREGQKDRLVILTAEIDRKRFESTFSPKGTVSYSSPAELKSGGKASTKDSHGFKLKLSEPKDVSLRAWVAE